MEAFLLALVLSASIPIFHVVIVRLLDFSGSNIKGMFISFFLYILVWLVAWISKYEFTTFYISGFIGGFSTIIFLCLVYMETFSMLCRGFSLRILTDIYLNETMNADDIILSYGEGRGMHWMLKKRIRSIERLKFVIFQDQILKIDSSIGNMIGWLGINFKKILKMGKGG